jgi:hypothetical protein
LSKKKRQPVRERQMRAFVKASRLPTVRLEGRTEDEVDVGGRSVEAGEHALDPLVVGDVELDVLANVAPDAVHIVEVVGGWPGVDDRERPVLGAGDDAKERRLLPLVPVRHPVELGARDRSPAADPARGYFPVHGSISCQSPSSTRSSAATSSFTSTPSPGRDVSNETRPSATTVLPRKSF